MLISIKNHLTSIQLKNNNNDWISYKWTFIELEKQKLFLFAESVIYNTLLFKSNKIFIERFKSLFWQTERLKTKESERAEDIQV